MTPLALILCSWLACVTAPLSPPARAQATPEPKNDAQSVRDRFNELSEEEQRRVLESYERWKKLPQDERQLMKRRFERLDTERRRTQESLDDDDRGRLDRLRDPERRRELTRRAKDALRERFDRLPPDLRRRIEHDLKSLPPQERAQRVKQFVKQHVEKAIVERLDRKVESGELPREAVDELRRQSQQEKDDPPGARLELLRRLIVDHPDAFHLTPDQVERIKKEHDAGFSLHLLERLRHRGKPQGERPRPPRDGARPRGI